MILIILLSYIISVIFTYVIVRYMSIEQHGTWELGDRKFFGMMSGILPILFILLFWIGKLMSDNPENDKQVSW